MSGRKIVVQQYHLINGITMSSTSYISATYPIQFVDNVGLQFTWHGTPTGTFAIDGSIDHIEDTQGNVQSAGNFVPLSVTFGSQPTASSGSILINLNQQPYPFIKVRYAPSTAATSGILDVWVGAKQL